MHPTFTLAVHRAEAWLTIAGELTAEDRHRLRWRLAEAEHLGTRGVLVDASQVEHLDVACVEVLAEWRGRLRAHGRRCELAATSLAVRLAALRAGVDLEGEAAPRPASAPQSTLDA